MNSLDDNKLLKLAFVTPEYVTEPSYSGGLANYLGRVTVALAERGHEVHVLTRSSEDGETLHHGVRVQRVLPWWGYGLEHVDPRVPRGFYNVYQDVKAAWCLWKRWIRLRRSTKFDLVQIANVQSVGLWFHREPRIPVVLRMSSYRPLWDTLAGTADAPGAKLRWRMEKRVAKRARFIYAPSEFVAQAVQKNYRINEVSVIETPFFREEGELDELAVDALEGKPFVLFFGRLTQMKGVHRLAEALVGLLDANRDMHAVFIGGDGVAPGGGSMRDYVSDMLEGYAPRVHMHASMRHSQLYPFVQRARVVAIPSLADNLPNTCLEAMGFGKIVVATTGSCFEQLIESGRNGWLIPPDNSTKLGEALNSAWLMSDDERGRMSAAAIERIERLSPKHAIPALEDYYGRVVAARDATAVPKLTRVPA